MNDYIKQLKSNLDGFKTSIKSHEVYHANDTKNYIGDYLEQKTLEYNAKRRNDLEKFISSCVADFDLIKSNISKAAFIDTNKTESATFKMFAEGSIELTPIEVELFLNKANSEHDFTLLRAISKYGEAHQLTLDILSADRIIDAYKTFFEGAISVAKTYYNDPSEMSETVVNAFAEGEFCEPLNQVIGNALFPNQSLSDDYAHSFDNVVLEV